jgi:hypothetical protein
MTNANAKRSLHKSLLPSLLILLLLLHLPHINPAALSYSSCAPNHNVSRLFKWIQDESINQSSTPLASLCVGNHHIHGGRSIFVSQNVLAGEILLSVPLRLTLNRLTASFPPLSLRYPRADKSIDEKSEKSDGTSGGSGSTETMSALFLLHARHVQNTEHGRWDHYIATLPSISSLRQEAVDGSITPPLFWTKKQRRLSRRSGVGKLVDRLRKNSKKTWKELLHPKHGRLQLNAIAARAFGTCTADDFQWALSMVLSRSFKIPVPWKRREGGGDFTDLRHVLIPGADLINYGRNANTHLRVEGSSMEDARVNVIAKKNLAKNEELTSDYGQLDSPCFHTLVHYGFCDFFILSEIERSAAATDECKGGNECEIEKTISQEKIGVSRKSRASRGGDGGEEL